jgi:hypothetical protein
MRYWTVIGEDLLVMSVADAYLRYYGSGVMLPSRRQDLCGRGRTVSIVVRGDRARLAGRCLRIGSQQRPPSGEHNEAHRGLELWRFSRLDRRTNDILRSPDFGRTRSFRIGSFLDQPQSRPDHPCDFRYLPDQLRPAPPQEICAAFLPSAPCAIYTSTSGTAGGRNLPWVASGSLRIQLNSVNGDLYLSVRTNCAPISGPVKITGNTMTAGDLAIGAIGCPEELSRQDQWVLEFLKRPVEMTLSQDTLQWKSGAHTLSFKSADS